MMLLMCCSSWVRCSVAARVRNCSTSSGPAPSDTTSRSVALGVEPAPSGGRPAVSAVLGRCSCAGAPGPCRRLPAARSPMATGPAPEFRPRAQARIQIRAAQRFVDPSHHDLTGHCTSTTSTPRTALRWPHRVATTADAASIRRRRFSGAGPPPSARAARARARARRSRPSRRPRSASSSRARARAPRGARPAPSPASVPMRLIRSRSGL